MNRSAVRQITSIVLIVLALIAVVPVAYVAVAGLHGWGSVSNGAATSGTLTITTCRSRLAGLVTSCDGTFVYNDPGGAAGAQPGGDVAGVSLRNSARHRQQGDVVKASLDRSGRGAYLSGAVPELETIGSAIAAVLLLTIIVWLVVRLMRRRDVRPFIPVAVFALAVLAAVGLSVPSS